MDRAPAAQELLDDVRLLVDLDRVDALVAPLVAVLLDGPAEAGGQLPDPLAVRLKQDVERWSRDEEGCGEGPVTAGWGAEQVVETKQAKKQEKSKKP